MKNFNRKAIIVVAVLAGLILVVVGTVAVRVHALTSHEWTYAGPEIFVETPFLAFSPDGTYEGSLGCNRVEGKYAPDWNGSFHTKMSAQTIQGCPDGELDLGLLDHFRVVGTDDSQLVFEDDGVVVARFERID
jgi:heat shock protein HslJ